MGKIAKLHGRSCINDLQPVINHFLEHWNNRHRNITKKSICSIDNRQWDDTSGRICNILFLMLFILERIIIKCYTASITKIVATNPLWGNAFEDEVVENNIVAVISLFVDLSDAAVAYRAFPFTLIEVFANPIDNTSNVARIGMIVFFLIIVHSLFVNKEKRNLCKLFISILFFMFAYFSWSS